MKDLYTLLGVNKDSSNRNIKKAYRKLALDAHPDKGGDDERMALLNEAYEILMNPEKKEAFDLEWETFHKEDEDTPEPVSGYIKNDWVPYSLAFKKQHEEFIKQYTRNPLTVNCGTDYFQPFRSSVYEGCVDIFSLIKEKSARSTKCASITQNNERLTNPTVIAILIRFLKGDYYGEDLAAMISYLSVEIDKTRLINQYASELLLYEGVFEIFSMSNKPSQGDELLFAIKKITDYAKQTDILSMPFFASLFQNKYFRNLFSQALHQYWQSHSETDYKELKSFDGVEATKTILDNLRMQLSKSKTSGELKKLIPYVRTLYKFEQDLVKDSEANYSAKFYRERAYHILDWIPAFVGIASQQIIMNIVLRIGVYFQISSCTEIVPAKKMSDEQLALQMYLTALSIAHHVTPDIELYAYIHGLKHISSFQYQHQDLLEIIQAFQCRALTIADLFPFFESISPNIDFLVKGQQSIGLMRNLLHTLVQIIEDNRAGKDIIEIDHDYVTVLYQVYEACLKNWYEEQHDPEKEQKFRLFLMDELLFKNGWTFLDLDENLNSPWIMLDQDEEGWMIPSPSLPWNNIPSIEVYRSLNGLELNYKTGEMRFLFKPVASNDPSYARVISTFDLAEMLERNVQGAFFSLDPVDPDILYHPFNTMRFAPTSIHKTEFLNTLLLTDYLLKFLTVGREVQGRYPYATRSLDKLTQHLPLYLKKIIEDFHDAQQSESLHRFWIEAEEVPVAIDDKKLQQEGIHRVALGDLKMVVKKHQMARDKNGELVDIAERDEGWNLYVLSRIQKQTLDRNLVTGIHKVQAPAIIVIEKQNEIYFLDETNTITQSFSMPPKQVYREKLIRLSKLDREEGKVIKSSQNSYQLYKLTRDITEHCGKPHKFTPEYIFAQEFTAHYNEFAQYYPEFGRLRELSRITVLIKLMNGMRENNKENIARLENILNDVSHWQARGNEINRAINKVRTKYKNDYDREYSQVHNKLKTEFDRLSRELNHEILLKGKLETLRSIQNQVGSLTFGNYSTEVTQVCNENYERMRTENYNRIQNEVISKHGYAAWNQMESELKSRIESDVKSAVESQRTEIANEFSRLKRENYRDQLNQLFSSVLSSLGCYEFNNLVNSFVNGNAQPLANVLAQKERAEAEKQISQSFSDQSKSDVIAALNRSTEAISRMAKKLTDKQFSEYKEQVEAEVVKANKVVSDEKQEVRTQRDKLAKVETTFKKVGLAKNDKEINLDKQCLWVLSNLRRNKSAGPSLVYGGVHVEPRVNVLSSNSLQHQNTVNSAFNSGQRQTSAVQVFNASAQRASNLRAQGYQEHHIISDKNERTRNHELFRLAGEDMNSRHNTMYLPKDASLHDTRTVHIGRHRNDVSEAARDRMNDAVETGKTENWTQEQYRAKLHRMQSEMRQELRSGNASLNKHERPWVHK